MLKALFSGYGTARRRSSDPANQAPIANSELRATIMQSRKGRLPFQERGIADPKVILQTCRRRLQWRGGSRACSCRRRGQGGHQGGCEEGAGRRLFRQRMAEGAVCRQLLGRPAAATQMLAVAFQAGRWNETHWNERNSRSCSPTRAGRPTRPSASPISGRCRLCSTTGGGALIPVFRDWLDAHNPKVGGHTPHGGYDMDNGWIMDEAWLNSLRCRRERERRRRGRARLFRAEERGAGPGGKEGRRRAEAPPQPPRSRCLTLFAASVLIFIGTEIFPGDLASAILQNTATPETLAELRLDLGLNRPAYRSLFRMAVRRAARRFRQVARQRPRRFDRDRAALRQHDVPCGLCGGGRGAARHRPRSDGCDPAGRNIRPARQCPDADDDFGAGIFSRLYADQIFRGRSRLVSVAGERLLDTRSSTGSISPSCRC